MAEEKTTRPKRRMLRQASETVRERSERSSQAKPKRRLANPLKPLGRSVARLGIWKPFKFIGRFLIPGYLRSSWQELRQVTWPNRAQSLRLTGAVIIFSVVFGVVIALFDYGLDKLFKQVITK